MMRFLALIGALAILAAIAAAIFFFGGFYDVAAIDEQPAVVDWALADVRSASIARHAPEKAPVSLDDPATIQAGARAFDSRGCVKCHGAPGVNWEKFSEGMRPYPADLKEAAPQLTAAEIFYVVKNGIKMTGMPSFGSTGVPDDEIWKIAAFVKKIPTATEADYKTWTAAQ
jgi:mono/diheme cytochrome c family protein